MLERAIEQGNRALEEPRPGERAETSVPIEVGSRVRTPVGSMGTVIELRDDGQVAVEVGSIRMVLGVDDLQVVEESAETPRRVLRPVGPARGGAPPPVTRTTTQTAGTETSLRGLRVDEAEAELVRALDAAVLADLPYLLIIHGKGTGALREMVQRVLAADPRVAQWGFAAANQGGTGVTVAEFRA